MSALSSITSRVRGLRVASGFFSISPTAALTAVNRASTTFPPGSIHPGAMLQERSDGRDLTLLAGGRVLESRIKSRVESEVEVEGTE